MTSTDEAVPGTDFDLDDDLLAAGVVSAQGLDVSNFQGAFDWDAALRRTPGLKFGIYRLTEGLSQKGTVSPDPTAQHNHDALKRLGLEHGAYHFLHPDQSGAAQAENFVKAHTRVGLTTRDMLWLDNEVARGVSPAGVSACARAFMDELDKLTPHNPRGVYTFISFAREGYCSGLGGRPLWLAYPAAKSPATPPPWARWTFWQWGERNGVDADAFNGTAKQLEAWIEGFQPSAGKNGKPTRHMATGLKSFREVTKAAGVSLHQAIWLLARERPVGGPMQRAYFNHGDMDANMPPGMIYFLP